MSNLGLTLRARVCPPHSQLSVSTVLHSLETERLQSEVLAVRLISAKVFASLL